MIVIISSKEPGQGLNDVLRNNIVKVVTNRRNFRAISAFARLDDKLQTGQHLFASVTLIIFFLWILKAVQYPDNPLIVRIHL